MQAAGKSALWIIAAVALLLVAVAALPFLVPLERFIPEIESLAKQKTGVPVKIGALRLFLLPTPHVTASAVQVGSKEVEVGNIAIYPGLESLLAEPKVIRLIEVDGLTLRDTLFAKLKLPKDGGGAQALEVRRVLARGVRPILNGSAVGTWDADVTLGGAIGVERATIKSQDGKITAKLTPQGKYWDVAVDAKDWRPPLGPPLVFSSLSVVGKLTKKTLDVAKLKASLYGGILTGVLKAEFAKRWVVSGNYRAQNIDVGALAKVFAPRQSVGGRLQADGRIAATAAKPEWLQEALNVDGKFAIANGVLYGFDFASAVTSVVKGAKGGATHFDRFSGDYHVQGRNVKLRNLVIASGRLAAKGGVDISGPNQQLAGTMDVEMKNTKGIVGVPVALSGTLKDPAVTPTRGSAIGAAVGTVVLPGIGTSVGASIGRFFEKKTENK